MTLSLSTTEADKAANAQLVAAAAAYGMLGENEALVANRKERGGADLEEVKGHRDRANAYQGKAEQLKAASEPPPELPVEPPEQP